MSMGIGIRGLKPITEDYKKRLEIYKSCRELKISPPEEIEKYFECDTEPCDEGIIVDLKKDAIKYSADSDRCAEFYDVDLSKLPEGVIKIRFEISW